MKESGEAVYTYDGEIAGSWKWKRPVIQAQFMPRDMMRIIAIVENSRVQSVMDITHEDAEAEGYDNPAQLKANRHFDDNELVVVHDIAGIKRRVWIKEERKTG